MFSQSMLKDSPYWDVIKTLAIVIGSISFIVFVALFGRLPIFRRTPIGWINRAIWIYIPNAFIKLDELVTGRRISKSLSRLFNYLMYEKHPLVMIFFISLLLGSEIIFVPPATKHVPYWHSYFLIPILVLGPYITLYFSYAISPAITASTHAVALTQFPYDYNIYHPHLVCHTCQRIKPARSKHCSICKSCIARHDHHCIWINNCVGSANYHHFLLLLVAMMAVLAYGAGTGYGILNSFLQEQLVPRRLTAGSLTSKKWATGKTWMEYFDIWSFAIAANMRIGSVTLLCFMSFPLATGFLLYHVYLVWAGTTTNETGKWADLREDIYDDIVFRARLQEMTMEYPASMEDEAIYGGEGKKARWPRRPEWWVTRTREGQHPMRRKPGAREYEGAEGDEMDTRFIRVKTLKEIDNLYDLGFWRNLRDAALRRR